ncbi:MAG: YkgJ family cysteine cluster protein [Desulfofustis sp.]|nr:YkgJ family cysteine cluster protein [Desulfofustis sp.]
MQQDELIKGDKADNAQDMSCLVPNRVYCMFCPGYCCYRLPGATLYLDALDINRIARYFEISDGRVRLRYLEGKNTFKVRADGSCIFLSRDRIRARCSIHAARPRQCREFPYDQPCPYLERDDLLEAILPKIERWLAETVIVTDLRE